MESRRIVLIGPMYPYRGGIAHFFETMYWSLQARGHEMHAVTFTRQYPKLLFPGKTQFETGAEPECVVPAERLIDSVNPVTWYRTARRIARDGSDVAIFKYWMPFFAPAFGTIARLLARRGIKSVVVVDNALPHERRPGDFALGRYFFRAMAGCVVMSDAVSRDMDRLGVTAQREFAAHPVYDVFGKPADRGVAREALGLPADAPVLLFFGFVRRYKGLHVLLDSMVQVVERLPEARLVIAGEFYDDERPYRERIATTGLADSVIVHPRYVPMEEVAKYFAAADVVVQPYVSATQSGVAQVAYQFDKPLITTNVGGLGEVVPHERAGLIVPPDDPSALAKAIQRFFTEDLAARLGEGVRQHKLQFGWDRLLDAVEVLM